MFTEDLDLYLADFGLATVFTLTTGSASAPTVIFDAAYLASFGVAGTNPTALGKASDFPASATVGGTLVISGTTYTVTSREPQDDGAFVLLQLQT